ncbi:MAG: cation-translocating P-type ATPase [Chloroflexi bacterium]|nr:cation-translocating P-type ATPase [Chloroflexota bacterium]
MTETVELAIRGMDCAECAVHVEERIGKIAGVASVKVFLTAERGVVSFDSERAEPAAFVRAIEELGYRVESPNATRQVEARQKIGELAGAARFAFVAVVAVLALASLLVERLGLFNRIVEQIPTPVFGLAVLVGGLPIFRSALAGVRARQINADLLMSIAIGAACVIGEFLSAALIVFFMSVAHFLEHFTTEKSRAAIRHLVALAPKTARVLRDGAEIEMPIEALTVGDVIVVRPGERLPADGQVIVGASAVDQSPITGESLPVDKRAGDGVYAASINQRGALQVRVTRVGRDSMLGKIVRLVEEAEAAKAPVQKFADRYSMIYLPVVLGVAFLTFLITRNPVNAIAVLLVACPCAIALATPLAVVAGVGRAASRGILIKGGLYLEALARVDTLVMDKTGTLTFGRPKVTDVEMAEGRWQIADLDKSKIEIQKSKILRLAASAEKFSEHPLASAILDEANARGIAIESPESFEVMAGQGVVARWNSHAITFGNRRLMDEQGIALDDALAQRADELERAGKTVMVLSDNHHVSGLIAVADVVREEAPQAMEELRRIGIHRMILLTGDNARVAAALAQQLGVEYRAEMLPEDKIAFVRELQSAGHRVAMIGDGINDAPALAQADVGIAMGVAGTDVAMDAAHVALMTDDWAHIPVAIRLARRTFRTIQQNIAFGLLFNVVGLSLASLGVLTPVMAAAAQSFPDVAVFVNSSRLLKSE